jgi:hypothetical protein
MDGGQQGSSVDSREGERYLPEFTVLRVCPPSILQTMKVICRDRQKTVTPEGRALNSVAADINSNLYRSVRLSSTCALLVLRGFEAARRISGLVVCRAASKPRSTSKAQVELKRTDRYRLLGRAAAQSDCRA